MNPLGRDGVSPLTQLGSVPAFVTMIVVAEQATSGAGTEDHSDPSRFRGEVADSPVDTGQPPVADLHRDAVTVSHDVFAVPLGGRRTVRWRNCLTSNHLLAAVNARWPARETAWDGSVGNVVHPSRRSDHHPWVVIQGVHVVRARCLDVNGIDAGWLAEQLRRLGAAGDPRLTNGGYVIFNERITSGDWHTWRRYTGRDPHTTRLHVSFSLSLAGFDNPAPWLFLEDDTVTPQDLRAVVNGLLDTQVPLRASGKGGHTTLRQVITQLERAIVPVRSSEPSETHQLVERLAHDVEAVRAALTQLTGSAGAAGTTAGGST